jgi:hypothetical protein
VYASGSPSSNLNENFNFMRQLRCLEIEIVELGTQNLRDPATLSLTQDFFRQARRLRRERSEHTNLYVTKRAA